VRIGIDMLAVQSPQHGPRGIGRYSANLVSALLAEGDGHEFVLYVHDGLPTDRVPASLRAEVRTLSPRTGLGEGTTSCLDRLVRINPDKLDVFVVLSAFERWSGYAPPARPPGSLKVVALVFDLIPFLFQDEHLVKPELMRHYHVVESITRYDLLLAISEATRKDCLSLLRLPPEQVVTIGGASEPGYFVPDRSSPTPEPVQETLRELGIDRPYVLNVGGADPRKNSLKLMDAFAALPPRLRETHQLVLTYAVNDWYRAHAAHHARKCGVEGQVVLTGEVSNETLRLLYQRCEVFAFPSLYEGFGLPILEAMHCGAAVVAGNNSSQVEVVGDAGLLADADNAIDLAAKIATLLDDPDLAQSLRARAAERASSFRWDRTARLALNAIVEQVDGPGRTRRVRHDRGHSRKPTIAVFSPLPPRKSGVSDYSAFLLDQLRTTYRIDLFHDSGYLPEPALGSDEFKCCDYRLFDRMAAAKDYHAIVYQMGNSRYHSYMYPILHWHRGLVTLHDFVLVGFHLHYGFSRGLGLGMMRDELLRWYPRDRDEIDALFETLSHDRDALSHRCRERGWHLNLSVLDASQLMVVHSPWCEGQVREGAPEYADRVIVIPHGIHPRRSTAAERAAVRDRFNLPQDALIVASFGFVHPDKMSPQALDAFATISRDHPKALFVFVGEEADLGEVRNHAQALGLNDRVRFLGRQPAEAFSALISVTDVGVNLRLPPTNGETSGALLNLLASGVPTIVTDVATFSDYPSNVVRKFRWETEGPDGLLRAMRSLIDDAPAREALGRAAWAYVDEYHEWSRVGELYVNAIERCHEEQVSARADVGRDSPAAFMTEPQKRTR
jgi:glycosyltransferase involved in cell wall biosynthesis